MAFSKSLLLVAIATVPTNAFVPSLQNKARSISFLPPAVTSPQSNVALKGFLQDVMGTTSESIPGPGDAKEEDIRKLFFRWNDALATLDSTKVASLYAKDGFLLPTVSDTPRNDFASIKDYFDNFLQLKPQGVILDGQIKVGDNWAKDCGIYEFTMGVDGSKVRARYTYVYTFEDGAWKIAHHHSSAMPEQMAPKGETLADDEVRSLFSLWNDALATLDPDTVAKRYSSKPILLPTVSDTPRSDYNSIKDYFVNFLQNKPQGVILESYVTSGPNWAKDAGIYEFTMGKDGSKVKARYSFVYVYEDGEWKISHHHSSVMPEAVLSKKKEITDDEVKGLFHLWNDALATLDSDKVAKRYAQNAVLLPTVSDIPRSDYSSIKDYFDNFLKLKPQGEIVESYTQCGDGWCKDVGVYEFTMGANGNKVKARYSFVYVWEDGEWKISHHHSSAMPEQMTAKGVEISEDEVRGLFTLWNDALATLDPETVAKRYASVPVLLPTVSDTPRTDFASIKDYFVNFLQLKPQGVILESFVTTGPNWAKDVGIYEFTLGKDGSKVKARYSFVYVYEDGEWKISHHHSSVMPEESKKEQITDAEAKALFHLWNDALATEDPDKVASRYAKNAVLLPTVSDTPRTDYGSIKDYFVNFLKLKPQGVILDSYTECGDGWCKDVGVYEFTMGANGNKVKARYSFVYVFEDGEWKISHHHSSAMPEQMTAKGEILSDAEVKGLFGLWNDALATLDPATVAKRYSKTPVLLPTVSDTPRTNFASIQDYFVNFLQLKPQGVILESHVSSGPNWAKDAGIYEFTMGADGSKVKARYSFIYAYEDGEWKISHHHSSVMPEASKAAAAKKSTITEKEVKGLFYLWNDALATLDSDKVARRYAKQAVLLPTVSDKPRTDYTTIKDYFDTFLLKKPQGEIVESFAICGDGWCKDVGIYEFTMGADGSKVKARYSFVYVFEDGEWKISHHHSSAMPEGLLGAAEKLAVVQEAFNILTKA